MNKSITVVIEYDKVETFYAQKFGCGMELLSGKVTGVMFDDALERIESLENEILELGERDE